MPKHTLNEQQIEDLQNLPIEKKVEKLAYIQKEIERTRQETKDRNASSRDYIAEMEAQRAALLEKKVD
jgi:uncharacterized small protein (DUF1192 family)